MPTQRWSPGLAEECEGPPDPNDDKRRRYYRRTGLGRAVCTAAADRLAALARTDTETCGLEWRDPVRGSCTFVWMYPRGFRVEFGEDVMQLLDDLEAERGRAAAWRICVLDLVVTLPRMHVERIMKPSNTTTVITWSIDLLAVGGAASFLTGVYSGLLLLVAVAALALAQRSSLASAIRVPDTALRHRRLGTAAALAGGFIASCGAFLATMRDSWTGGETALALVGTTCMIGASIDLLAGLLTPRDAARQV